MLEDRFRGTDDQQLGLLLVIIVNTRATKFKHRVQNVLT